MEGLERTIASLETMTRDIWQSLTDLRAENRRDHESVVAAINELKQTTVSKEALDRVEEVAHERDTAIADRVNALESSEDKRAGMGAGLKVLLWVLGSIAALLVAIVTLMSTGGTMP